MKLLKIGTRPSPLAIKQVDEIRGIFYWVEFIPVYISTCGDKDKLTSLANVKGSDFFTKEIDQALLNEEIDVALHSSKDLPDKLPKGLRVVIETKSINPFDALVSRDGSKLLELSSGSRIGTSSLRRRNQIQELRPDLEVVDIRGNIEERLALVDSGQIDALIVAQAALIRLRLEHRVCEIFTAERFPVHPEQGSLTLVSREDKWQEVKFILSAQAPVIGS